MGLVKGKGTRLVDGILLPFCMRRLRLDGELVGALERLESIELFPNGWFL